MLSKDIERYFLKAQLDAYARKFGTLETLQCIAWFLERANGRMRSPFKREKLELMEVLERLEAVIGRKVYEASFDNEPAL